MTVDKVFIYLGSKEYGNELMAQVADEYAAQNSNRPLVVEVHEHAGWFLAYLYGAPRIKDGTICGTANDGASLSQAVMDFGRGVNLNILPEIRR